jgi:hypothetical protein
MRINGFKSRLESNSPAKVGSGRCWQERRFPSARAMSVGEKLLGPSLAIILIHSKIDCPGNDDCPCKASLAVSSPGNTRGPRKPRSTACIHCLSSPHSSAPSANSAVHCRRFSRSGDIWSIGKRGNQGPRNRPVYLNTGRRMRPKPDPMMFFAANSGVYDSATLAQENRIIV